MVFYNEKTRSSSSANKETKGTMIPFNRYGMRCNNRIPRKFLQLTFVLCVVLVVFCLYYIPRMSVLVESPADEISNQRPRERTIAQISGIAIRNDVNQWYGYDSLCNNSREAFVFSELITPSGLTPIYLYNSEYDPRVSKSIIESGSWKSEVVLELRELLDQNDRLVLLDIGAGLGVFSLAAALGHKFVVAIEPSPGNARRLCESIIEGRFQRRISIINNALSDKAKMMELEILYSELSNVHVHEITSSDNINLKVPAIPLDDLIDRFPFVDAVIRIDVGGENMAKILKGGNVFFRTVNVWSVMVTWSDVTEPEDIQYICNFMDSKGMKPHGKASGKKPLSNLDPKKWPAVVIFKKAHPDVPNPFAKINRGEV